MNSSLNSTLCLSSVVTILTPGPKPPLSTKEAAPRPHARISFPQPGAFSKRRGLDQRLDFHADLGFGDDLLMLSVTLEVSTVGAGYILMSTTDKPWFISWGGTPSIVIIWYLNGTLPIKQPRGLFIQGWHYIGKLFPYNGHTGQSRLWLKTPFCNSTNKHVCLQSLRHKVPTFTSKKGPARL